VAKKYPGLIVAIGWIEFLKILVFKNVIKPGVFSIYGSPLSLKLPTFAARKYI